MEKATRKNIISAIITIFILLIGVFAFLKMSSMKTSTVSDKAVKKERRKVKYDTFETSTSENSIALDGRLKAHESVTITAKVQGIMLEGNGSVRPGEYFKKGQLLFAIDRKEAAYALKAQKSALLTSITAMMPDFKFDYPEAFGNWEKYLNEFDLDADLKPLPEASSQQEKFFVAGKNIYNQFYTIKSQETKLKEYNIYAPFSGVITDVNVYPGALINPSQNLATMINTSRYEIKASVPLDNAKYIKTGQGVTLYSDELEKSWNGKVSRIGTQIDANTQNLPIYISVTGQDLKDGMYLKGSLQGKALDNVTKLPKSIFLSPNSVFVIEDSTLVAKQIIPVKRGEDFVLVKGIEKEDKIIVGALAGLFEGQKVNY